MPSKLVLLTVTCAPVAFAFFAPVPISNHQLNGVFRSTIGGTRQRKTPLHITVDQPRIGGDESERLRRELTDFSALSKKKTAVELGQFQSEGKKIQHKFAQFFSPESAREKARSIVNGEIAEIEAERAKIRKQIVDSDKAREVEILKIEADRAAREKQIAQIEADRVKIQQNEIARIEAERVAREKQIAQIESERVKIQQEIAESAKKREKLRLEILESQNVREKLNTEIAASKQAREETRKKLNTEIAKEEEMIIAKKKKLEEINTEPMGLAALMKASPAVGGVTAFAAVAATLAGGRQLMSQRQTVKDERAQTGTAMAANRQARTVAANRQTRTVAANRQTRQPKEKFNFPTVKKTVAPNRQPRTVAANRQTGTVAPNRQTRQPQEKFSFPTGKVQAESRMPAKRTEGKFSFSKPTNGSQSRVPAKRKEGKFSFSKLTDGLQAQNRIVPTRQARGKIIPPMSDEFSRNNQFIPPDLGIKAVGYNQEAENQSFRTQTRESRQPRTKVYLAPDNPAMDSTFAQTAEAPQAREGVSLAPDDPMKNLI